MSSRYQFIVLFFVVVLALAACGSEKTSQATLPTVVITAPVASQQVQQGNQLEIQATATDALGVARVEVGVDGVLLGTFENPSPAANAPFSVQQFWTATAPGSHSVMVVAYNTAGAASGPTVVSISVVAAGQAPAPTATTGSVAVGPAATPTWTVIAVSGGPSPTVESPSAEPPPAQMPSPTATTDSSGGSSGGGTGGRPSAPAPSPNPRSRLTAVPMLANWPTISPLGATILSFFYRPSSSGDSPTRSALGSTVTAANII